MKDFLLKTLLNLKGEKLIRHALTGLIGVAAAHGVVLNIDNTASFLSGGLLLIGVIFWSAWRKAPASDEVLDILKVIATSVGTQLATLSAGYLTAKGIASPDQAQTPAAAVVAVMVYLLSNKAAPDAAKKIVPMLLLMFMCGSLTACDNLVVAKRADGSYLAQVGSLGQDAERIETEMTLPDGTLVKHTVVNPRQAKSLRGAVMASAMPEIVGAATSGAAKLTDAVSSAVK